MISRKQFWFEAFFISGEKKTSQSQIYRILHFDKKIDCNFDKWVTRRPRNFANSVIRWGRVVLFEKMTHACVIAQLSVGVGGNTGVWLVTCAFTQLHSGLDDSSTRASRNDKRNSSPKTSHFGRPEFDLPIPRLKSRIPSRILGIRALFYPTETKITLKKSRETASKITTGMEI